MSKSETVVCVSFIIFVELDIHIWNRDIYTQRTQPYYNLVSYRRFEAIHLKTEYGYYTIPFCVCIWANRILDDNKAPKRLKHINKRSSFSHTHTHTSNWNCTIHHATWIFHFNKLCECMSLNIITIYNWLEKRHVVTISSVSNRIYAGQVAVVLWKWDN